MIVIRSPTVVFTISMIETVNVFVERDAVNELDAYKVPLISISILKKS